MTTPPLHLMRKGLLTRPLAVLLLLCVLTTLIYSNTFSVPFLFDDKPNILENPQIKDLNNFFDLSGSRYMGFLSFALNYHFGGLHVFGYHLVNLLIHITNGFLVYILVLLLFQGSALVHSPLSRTLPLEGGGKGGGATLNSQLTMAPWIALATALLFVVHPIQTQAVTFIVQRFASLAALFYLLAVVCYLKWRLADPQAKSRYLWYATAMLSTVLAMKTKENSFTLPFMILVVEAVFFRPLTKIRLRWRWVALIPFLLTLPVIPLSHPGAIGEGEAGFAQETTEISRSDYLFTQFQVIVTYIRLLFLPIHQNLDYDYPIYHSLFAPGVFLSFLFLCTLFALSLYLLFASPLTPSASRLTAFGILWFFLTLSIESSIIPIRDVIFEHRLYLPSVGFFMVLSVGVMMGRKWLQRQGIPPAWGVIGLGAVVLVLSAATYQRNMVWKDDLTLWQDVVAKSPNKARGYNGLAVAYHSKGMIEAAIEAYQSALRLQPDSAIVYNNLGTIHATQGRLEEAIRAYQKALKLKPDYAEVHNNLGNIYTGKGRLEEAIRAFQFALKLKPDYPEVHNNLGYVYATQGRLEEAIRAYQKALKLNPDYATAHKNLGHAYAAQEKLEEAIHELQAALQVNPRDSEAHFNLANVLKQQGQVAEAKAEFERALKINPDYLAARQALESLSR